ncbi:MAG: ComEA family DNA-binding protein [Lachnospiraceae bacterium]|nr:ComEA family DNA-binding protein [Lachnospiraceae bacterium]
MQNKRQDKIRARKAVLLFVLFSFLMCLEGCSRRSGEVYVAGPGAELSAEETVSGNHSQADPSESKTSEARTLEPETWEPETEGYVYVCGAVRRPGVYPIYSGTRVFEAIELAGGFDADADEEWLNQAGRLQDGQQLYIYSKAETQQMQAAGMTREMSGAEAMAGDTGAAAPSAADAGGADGKINLNTADAQTLMTLPGIGEVKAEAIIEYRIGHGGFSSIEEIQNIPGIKQAVFSKIADRITI